MLEAAFLTFLTLGLALLISGIIRARMHWRPDIEAYGRSTPRLALLFHPERFVSDSAAQTVKRLGMGGAVCIGLAFGLVVYEIVFVVMLG